MSIKGSPYQRFIRALETGNPLLVRSAAAELPHVSLADALAICLVLLDREPELYGRAAARWTARYCLEVRGVALEEAVAVLGAMALLRTPHRAVARRTLLDLCSARNLGGVCEVLEPSTRRDITAGPEQS